MLKWKQLLLKSKLSFLHVPDCLLDANSPEKSFLKTMPEERSVVYRRHALLSNGTSRAMDVAQEPKLP